MSECYDCIYYKRYRDSPPECSNHERPEEELWPPEQDCRWKLSIADAKAMNKEEKWHQ